MKLSMRHRLFSEVVINPRNDFLPDFQDDPIEFDLVE